MAELPREIYSVQQVREFDLAAIDRLDISGYELMCRAGEAAMDALAARWPMHSELTVFCGAGNNAGDGYVLARLAAGFGKQVRTIAVTSPEKLTGAAVSAWEEFRSSGLSVEAFGSQTIPGSSVVADALLGTGLDRDLDGHYRDAVTSINSSAGPVLALDIPTGLNADSGLVMGTAVRADLTVTFVGLKAGQFLGQAADFCGEVVFAGLGITEDVYVSHVPVLELLTTELLRQALPPRRPTAHKGSYGSLLLVGGGPGMPGAIRLAAEAALRTGAGLVRVATHADSVTEIVAGRPEIMCQPIDGARELDVLIDSADGVVLGPGLGRSEWSRSLVERVVDADLPVVLDADGLNLLAEKRRERDRWILTPHPGEAARLGGCSTTEIQTGRLAAAKGLAKQYGAVLVLKGAGTLVAEPGDRIPAVCSRGNPGMATAGMGDVLAGVIGSLLVQTRDLSLAARAGVLLHAMAGDAAITDGKRGLLARDLMPHLRRLANPV